MRNKQNPGRLSLLWQWLAQHALINTLLAIVLGVAVGALIFLLTGFDPLEAYAALFTGVFGSGMSLSWMIIRATPLLMTGLSVAFAFKTGMFNVGAEGQFIVGSIAAVITGAFVQLPAVLHVPLCMLAAMAAAGLWGGIAGLLKARFGVSEVISTIMLNWIALHLNNYLTGLSWFAPIANVASYPIADSANIGIFKAYKASEAGKALISENGFLGSVLRTPVNYGILVALLAALFVWFILRKTTLGYQLKAVGYNTGAAEYGGINANRRLLQSMVIAGALAGLGGALHIMGNVGKVSHFSVTEGFGFDGMAVALIGNTSPLGTVLASLLYSTLTYGGTRIQASVGAPTEVISIVTGTIVLFIAMPRLIQMIRRWFGKRERKVAAHD